jgi:hypothetical protein
MGGKVGGNGEMGESTLLLLYEVGVVTSGMRLKKKKFGCSSELGDSVGRWDCADLGGC